MTENLQVRYGTKTILELQKLQEQGHLNLEPGFQRKSVWTQRDRRLLIQSVLEGCPVPSIFLYRRDENGALVYDVLDGKQRLETIFMFSRVKLFGRQSFDVQYRFPGDDAEFYTLFMVVWGMHQQKLILNDRNRNRTAMRLLRRFSDGVDEVREQQRRTKGAKPHQRLYADYLLLVQQSTDALGPRKRRAEMIEHLLGGLFEKKDDRRIFSAEQRRLLWNSEEKKKCAECDKPLDWTNFQVDHVRAHSKGGRRN